MLMYVYISYLTSLLVLQWDLSNLTNVSDCTGFWNTLVLFLLLEIPLDHKFLSDVTGCRKTQVSDCTSSTVCLF
jgi:hypothetical protein